MSRRPSGGPVAKLATLAAVASLALAGCSTASGGAGQPDPGETDPDTTDTTNSEAANSEATTGDPVPGGTLTLGIESDPGSLFNVHQTAGDIAAFVLRNVFDSLVVQDPDGSIQPWLAESWEISDDGLTYTFHLQEGVTFSNGEVFDAAAVKANFDNVVSPDTKSQYAASLIGGTAYAGTEVIDEYTVEISLNEPFAPLLQGLSTTYLGFYAPSVLENGADQLAAGGPEITIGTGPWILDGYVAGQAVNFSKNPDYNWGPANATHTGPVHPDQLVYKILPEATVRSGALGSGEIDIAGNVSPVDVPALEADPSLTITTTDAPGLPWSIFLHHSNGIFEDPAIRQSFQRGIDITSAVEAVYGGIYKRAWGPLTPATVAYDASVEGTWEYDETLANEILDDAGWAERDADGFRTQDGEQLGATWTISTTREDRASLVAPIQNAAWVNDPQVDEWVTQGSQEIDPEARVEIYSQVQQWVIDDAALVPVYVPGNITASRDTVHGLRADITGWPLLYDAWTTAGS